MNLTWKNSEKSISMIKNESTSAQILRYLLPGWYLTVLVDSEFSTMYKVIKEMQETKRAMTMLTLYLLLQVKLDFLEWSHFLYSFLHSMNFGLGRTPT